MEEKVGRPKKAWNLPFPYNVVLVYKYFTAKIQNLLKKEKKSQIIANRQD